MMKEVKAHRRVEKKVVFIPQKEERATRESTKASWVAQACSQAF